jgi:hypothetical protein
VLGKIDKKSFSCVQMKTQLEATKAEADAAVAQASDDDHSCTTDMSSACTHKKALQRRQLSQEMLAKQEQRTQVAEQRADRCAKRVNPSLKSHKL